MEPTTLRLSEELRDELDQEAEQLGMSSRSEYIRYLLANRDATRQGEASEGGPATSGTDLPDEVTEQISSLTDRLEVVEAQVTTLEDTVEDMQSQSDIDVAASQAAETESDSGTPPEVAGAGSRVDDQSNDADNIGDADGSEEAFSVLSDWLLANGPNSEVAQDILVDTARILHARGPLGASELRDALHERYPEAYSSPDTLWSATVNRWYEDSPGIEKVGHGTYAFNPDEIIDSP